jgi:hypothetical protein
MKAETPYPPVGANVQTPGNGKYKSLLACTPYVGEHTLKGNLSVYLSPEFEVRFLKGNECTKWHKAIFDTGSYYSLAKLPILQSIHAEESDTTAVNDVERGDVSEPMYAASFQVEGMPFALATSFLKLRNEYNYGVIIGSHILEICDLHIFGKEKRFELIFK